MKNFKLLICVVLAALAFASCSDTETYADMKKKERSAINRYITNQKINVISESQFEQQGCTTDTAKNEYVLFENTGVYMQIRSKGTGEKLKDGEDVDVTCRFNEYNLLACTFIIFDNFLAADLINEVYSLIVSLRNVVWFIVEDDFSHHHSMLTKHFGKLTSVDTCNTWHMLTLQPLGKTLASIPM